MKKKLIKSILLLSSFFISVLAYTQIGINKISPIATLDIEVKKNELKAEGLIIPRLTGDELKERDDLYGLDHDGIMIYITEASSDLTEKTRFVDKSGFYFYDGIFSVWKKFNPNSSNNIKENIYAIISKDQVQNITNIQNGNDHKGTIVSWSKNIKGINANKITLSEDGKYIKFPPNRTFKITGMLGVANFAQYLGGEIPKENPPSYIISVFKNVEHNENIDFISTIGFVESSTETWSDGGVTLPTAIFSTGEIGLNIYLEAFSPADNRDTKMAGPPLSTSLGSYLIVEEI